MAFWQRWFGSDRSAPPEAPAARKDGQDFRALLQRTGFAAAAAQVERLALPCLDILYAGPGDAAPLGASRFGGAPDLPEDAAWPVTTSGTLLSFYGQIDLAAPEVLALDAGLPRAGLLSLFVGAVDEASELAPVAVLMTQAGTPLQRRTSTGDFDDRSTARLKPVGIRFEWRLSYPPLVGNAAAELEALCPDGDIDDLSDGLRGSRETLGQLLGHAPSSVEDLRERLHFLEIGRSGQETLRVWPIWEDWERAKTLRTTRPNGTTYRPWTAKDDANVRWQQARKAEIDAGVARWQSLLAIRSNAQMGLSVNDAGAVFTFFQADDLARGNVSRVRAIATQG